MVYYIQPGSGTVSAISVELDGAATSGGSYTALTPAVGGGSGSGSTLNPVTSFPQGQNNLCCDFYPFLRIKVNTLTVSTGSPILIVKVIGYAGTTAAAGTGGGGGGGGLACLNGDVDAGTGSCTSATVVGLAGVPFCSGFTPTNGQFLKYTTGGSPNPCYSAAAGGGTIASTTNALVGDGAGNAIAASGTATNCVLVNGSSLTCGGGGPGLTVYSGLAGISLSGATIYFPVGGGSLASSTEANVQTFQGTAGTVSGFGASISAALGSGNSAVLTWRKNSAGQTVTCTITNPATTCSDTTHSFTFAASDTLDIQAVFTGTIVATPIWVMNAGISSGSSPSAGSFVLVEQHTASSSASLNFTTGITATYDEYVIEILNLVPDTGGGNLLMRMSTDGGATYDSGSNYSWDGASWRSGEPFLTGGGVDTALNLTVLNGLTVDTNTAYGVSYTLRFYSPLSTTLFKQLVGKGFLPFPGVIRVMAEFGGQYTNLTAVNAFTVLFSAGNILSGTVRLYGLAH